MVSHFGISNNIYNEYFYATYSSAAVNEIIEKSPLCLSIKLSQPTSFDICMPQNHLTLGITRKSRYMNALLAVTRLLLQIAAIKTRLISPKRDTLRETL